MNKNALFAAPGGTIKTGEIKLEGQVQTLFYKTRTPNEIALFTGAERRYPQNEEGDLQREVSRAAFIAAAFCNEDGSPLMTKEEAQQVPNLVKFDLCMMVVTGSGVVGEAGKASLPGVKSTSGAS